MKNVSGDHNYFSKMPACLNTNSLFFARINYNPQLNLEINLDYRKCNGSYFFRKSVLKFELVISCYNKRLSSHHMPTL